jgi:hypothetical protein
VKSPRTYAIVHGVDPQTQLSDVSHEYADDDFQSDWFWLLLTCLQGLSVDATSWNRSTEEQK